MKKVFTLTAQNKKPGSQLDTIRKEINKYISRERRKTLPDEVDFWDFDCKIGDSAQEATAIDVSEIKNSITKLAAANKSSFYLEILAKPGHKPNAKGSD